MKKSEKKHESKSLLIFMYLFTPFVFLVLAIVPTDAEESQIVLPVIVDDSNLPIENTDSDAKYFDEDTIITSIGGMLSLYSKEKHRTITFNDFKSNWIDVIPEDNIAICSNWDKKVYIVIFDDNKEQIIDTYQWRNVEKLSIDPTIIHWGSYYYVTLTEITGLANNGDPQRENGEYLIKLYRSKDLRDWDYVTTVKEGKGHNLEDPILAIFEDKLLLIYEDETYDRQNSSICAMYIDTDNFRLVKTEVLSDPVADQEPASICIDETRKRITIYYSSDLRNPGSSYAGAEIYYLELNENLAVINSGIIVNQIDEAGGICLYDTYNNGNSLAFLGSKEMTDENNTVIYKLVEWIGYN